MFKKQITYAIAFLFACGLFVVIPLFRLDKKEKKQFEKLMEVSSKKRNDKGMLSYSESVRQGVVKEVWFKEKDALHMCIHSKESALYFFNEGKTFEVVEQLGDVECLMQEKLYYLSPEGKEVSKKIANGKPMQEIRFLQAKKACYNYTTQLFFAEDVHISKYKIAGHTLPKEVGDLQPLMRGKAESVEFTLKGEKVDFKADHFKATFDPKKGML